MPEIRKTQNDFTSGVLTSSVRGRTDIAKYASGCKRIVNGLVKVHGGVSNRPGTYCVDYINSPGRYLEFEYSVDDAYVLLFYEYKMRIYRNGAVIVYPAGHAQEGEIVEITTPYAYSDLSRIKITQSADVLFLVHTSYTTKKLTRTDHHAWTFEDVAFDPEISVPAIPTLVKDGFSGTGKNIEYKISAVSETEEESYPSPAANIDIDSTWPQGATITVSWGVVEGAVRYRIYKSSRGFFGLIGTVKAEDGLEFTDDYIEEDASDGPKEAKNPFADNNNPGAVGIYQQRLLLGGTSANPQTTYGSCIGSLNNFSISYPLKSNDSIEGVASSLKMNEIRHYVPLQDVLILTSGAEIVMSAGRNADAITPTGNLHFNVQSYWGCSEVPPLVAGNNIIMLQNSGRIVRDLFYSMGDNGYVGTELSILANDLLEVPIVDWCYQNEPYHIVYACREDGKMLTLTYMREQEVYAWSMLETQGDYISVATVRNGRNDDVYFLVKRGDKYFVEYQKRNAPGDTRKDAFYVDCGLTYEGDPITHVTGLDHLAGEKISVLGDGNVYLDIEVAPDGSFDLPRAHSTIHAGLPYQFLVETLDPEITTDRGSTRGALKKVNKMVFQLDKSAEMKAGYDDEHLTRVKFPPPAALGDAPLLYTGNREVKIENKYRDEASIVFVQDMPLPLNVLSVTSEIEVGSK